MVARMDEASVAAMASAVAVTAAAADAAVAKAAAQKVALKDVQTLALMVGLKIAATGLKAVALSAASAARSRALKAYAKSVRTALLARCVPKHHATTAVQTCKPVVMASNATKVALRTAKRASHVLTVRAASAHAANAVIAQNAVTAFHAMP